MFSFAVDYFIMVFVASLGVMQAAASVGGLRGLLVFKNPLVARPLGIALAVAAIVWFFATAERNINDYEGGLDSNQQALLFFLAVAASGMLTCLLTSLLNWRMVDSRLRGNDGKESRNDGTDGGNDYVEIHPHPNLPPSRGKGLCRCLGRANGGYAPDVGLGALRQGSWWQALTHNYRYWFSEAKCWRTRIKRYFSG